MRLRPDGQLPPYELVPDASIPRGTTRWEVDNTALEPTMRLRHHPDDDVEVLDIETFGGGARRHAIARPKQVQQPDVPADVLGRHWHVGRSTGRAIYAGETGEDMIGAMDTRELAEHVVELHNAGDVRPDFFRTLQHDAWMAGYQACRRGDQQHSPYRAPVDPR